MITADSVLAIFTWLKENGITIWIDGGWSVDALIGKQTREHDDLDIAVHRKDNVKLRKLLESNGYTEEKRFDSSEFMYVMVSEPGISIDVHVFEYDKDRNNTYGIKYPFGSLTGTGTINGQSVNCIDPAFMLQFKTGYEPKEKDLMDIRALCEKYGFKRTDINETV